MAKAKFEKKLTEAEQIKKAKAILKRPGISDPDLEDFIKTALDDIEENATEAEQSNAARSAKSKAELRTLTKRLRSARISANRLPPHMSVRFHKKINELVQFAERLERLPPGPRYRGSIRAQLAASFADMMLFLHGKLPKITRGKDYHRLTAILYGDDKLDLFRHLRLPDFGPDNEKNE
jgi:hypothetical protein